MVTNRYRYNHVKIERRTQRHLVIGLRWLIKRFTAHMRLRESMSDVIQSPQVISALFLNMQKDGIETALTADSLEQQIGDSTMADSGRRIRKFAEISQLLHRVKSPAPHQTDDETLDTLYHLFHNLVISTVFQIKSSRRQRVKISFELQADLHFYVQALGALGRYDDLLLFVGHAYPFDEIPL
jgi:hypothetical protein